MTLYSVIASDSSNTSMTPKYGVALYSRDRHPKFIMGTLEETAKNIYGDYKNSKDFKGIRVESPNRDLVAQITKEGSEITRQLTDDEMRHLTSYIRSYMINPKSFSE